MAGARMRNILELLLIAGLLGACQVKQMDEQGYLIVLKNGQVEAGIVPDLGGRVVFLRKPGMDNILKSDRSTWQDPSSKPEISAYSEFAPLNGHIVWLSPQSEWWTKQDINLERRRAKAQWPPDPYLIYGSYKVIEQDERHIKMTGPESPVSGVQLIKEVSLDPDSAFITFTVLAVNKRDEPVSWGLWMNTRFNGNARCYVPADSSGLKNLLVKTSDTERPLPYTFEEGYFTFNPPVQVNAGQKYVQKAFLEPRASYIAAFDQKQVMIISFAKIPAVQIHPEQAAVEIYNMCDSNDRLLELEIHGPYRKLTPLESISLTEQWQIRAYDGADETDDHIRFLDKIMSKTGN